MNEKKEWEVRLEKRLRRANILTALEIIAVVLFLVGFVFAAAGYAISAYNDLTREPEAENGASSATVKSTVCVSEVPVVTVPAVDEYRVETAIASTKNVKTVRYPLSDYQRDLVERVVMAEASGEDYDGQCLVAQCILNSAEAEGVTPDVVVSERGQYASPASYASDSVKAAVSAVFDDGYEVTSECIRWFYAPARCRSTWHETALCFVLEHGGHRFFK